MGEALLLYLFVLAVSTVAIWQANLTWLRAVTFYVLLPAGSLWLWWRGGRSIYDLGLRLPRAWKREIGWGFSIGLVMLVMLNLSLALSGSLTTMPTAWPVPLLIGIIGGILLAFLKTALTVSIEELVFRGYFLQRFRLDVGNAWGALLAALLFALSHASAILGSGLSTRFVVIVLLSWFIFGLALCLGALRTGNLWFPWGLHYGYNLASSLVVFFAAGVSGHPVNVLYLGPAWWVGQFMQPLESGLVGLLLGVVILVLVWLVTRNKPQVSGDRT